jgi:hypothetical protein
MKRKPAFLAFAVLAWTAGAPASAADAPPAVDPSAVSLLQACGDRLKAAETLSFTATSLQDVPNADGQSIIYAERSRVDLQRPDKLRIATIGDGPASLFLSDGTTMTAYRPAEKTIATAPAPASMDAVLEREGKAIGRSVAFADVLVADPAKGFTDALTRAFIVGRSRIVGGVETDIVAFSAPDADGQIWIGVRDKLPRQLLVTYTKEPGQPRDAVTFSGWRVDHRISRRAFRPVRSRSATTVPFANPGS